MTFIPDRCPWCDYLAPAMARTGPDPGTVLVCESCGQPAIVRFGGGLRRPDAAERPMVDAQLEAQRAAARRE